MTTRTDLRLVARPDCPFCGGTEHAVIVSVPFSDPRMTAFLDGYYQGRIDARIEGAYTIAKCRPCGGLWQREILDAGGMAALYGRWIDPAWSLDKRRQPRRALDDARRMARLRRLLPADAPRVLDYGMGWGDFARMAQAFGCDVTGVELSLERVADAGTRGIRAYTPDTLPVGEFDYIELEQVLEHLPSPTDTLRRLIGSLRPGGYIHVGVPDGSRVERAGRDPAQLLAKGPAHPLEHINIFTPPLLRGLMARLGCVPAGQREVLIRVWPPVVALRDALLAVGRHLPPSLFPGGTNRLFRKATVPAPTRR